MSATQGKKLLRKVLFLEIAGFLSLAVSVAVVFMVVAMHTTDLTLMVIPFAGLGILVAYILITIGYMRKDLHRIHELHSKPIYSIGRFVIYAIGAGLILYSIYLFATTKDFWSDIGMVVISNVSVIVGVFAIYYTLTLGYLIEHEHLRHSGVSVFDMLVLIVFPIGIVAYSVVTMFGQKAVTVTEGEADFMISAQKIIGEFESNDSMAKSKYVGKSIRFAGRVVEIVGDSAVLLKLDAQTDGYTTNCGFDKSLFKEVSKVKTGDSLDLQCSCSGVTSPDGEMDLLSEKSLDMVRCKLLTIHSNKP